MIYLIGLLIVSALYLLWLKEGYPRLVAATTAIPDLHDPAFGTRTGPKIKGTAVVCGGSIAGCLSAAVLSKHFEKVVIVEAEELPMLKSQVSGGTPENVRRRVPQYLQPHGFLNYALGTYRRLFPDFDAEVIKLGGRIGHWQGDFAALGRVLGIDRSKNSVELLALSRDGLEPLVRRLLLSDPTYSNVSLRTGTVVSFARPATTGPIASVRIRGAEKEQDLDATFVVDATGVTGLGSKLLPKLGLAPIRRQYYDPGQFYRSIMLDVSEATKKEIEVSGVLKEAGYSSWEEVTFISAVGPSPEDSRYGALTVQVEGDRVILAITHAANDANPSTLPTSASDLILAWASIPAFSASSLKICDLLIKGAMREDPANKFTLHKGDIGKSIWHDMAGAAAATDFPQNFVSIGDAHIKVNPQYASGTMTAAQQAVTLDASLRAFPFSDLDSHRFAHEFFLRVAPRLLGNWTLMAALDFADPSCVPSGEDSWTVTNFAYPLVRGVFHTIYMAGVKDKDIGEAIFRVINGMDAPFALFAPWLLLRVARAT